MAVRANATESPWVAVPAVREPVLASWTRRAVTIPLYVLAFLVVWGLSPVWLLAGAATDLARRRGFVVVRCIAMLMSFLLAEMVGITRSSAIWLRHRGWRRTPSPEYLRSNFRLQCWWVTFLFRAGVRWFSLRVEVEGDESLRDGPVILFIRHASPVDNLIPAVYGSVGHGLRLRWLVNRWLLRDPCIDIVGNRLPNAFVRGGTQDTERMVSLARALATGLGAHDGVLSYPEGGLFSPARRTRIIQRLQETDPDAATRAASLRHVLPPRMGGSLALLEAAPDAGVAFCAHSGLEVAGSYRALLSGDLVGRNVRINFWRVPRHEVPPTESARAEWLWEQWQQVDDWIEANRQMQPERKRGER